MDLVSILASSLNLSLGTSFSAFLSPLILSIRLLEATDACETLFDPSSLILTWTVDDA